MLDGHLSRISYAVALAMAACGGQTSSDDGSVDGSSDAPSDIIQGPDIRCPMWPSEQVEIDYLLCDDGGTDGGGGSIDGGDGGTSDANPCFTHCFDACRVLGHPQKPGFSQSGCMDGWEDAGTRHAVCSFSPLCGRRPPGATARINDDSFAGWLAGAAWMEAVSVLAFERLARELAAHGAPGDLVREARRAARDERRHARIMGEIAREHGARVPRARLRHRSVRSLAIIARENAVEGCVRETYGALLASWQAIHARDPELRAAMRSIAPDERRHAALAAAVDEWISPRLSPRTRRSIARAMARARASLHGDAPVETGLPTRAQSRVLIGRLFAVPSKRRAHASDSCF